jgi:DNA-directed RNA polymerase subunit RPC12/RpoP
MRRKWRRRAMGKIRCARCGHEWDYKGGAYFTRCNYCNARVKVRPLKLSDFTTEEEKRKIRRLNR